MAAGNDLTCPLCCKHSDNNEAHIRHKSYCRRKAKSLLRPRRRSCRACIKGKTHCDVATSPCCSRCRQKGIECKLEHGQREDALTARSEPSLTIDIDGLCSSDALGCSGNEHLLVDWTDASFSHSCLDEELDTASSQVDQVGGRQGLHQPMSAVGNASQASPLASAKDSADRWLPYDPNSDQCDSMNLYALGPQLSLNPMKAFTPRGPTWGRFSLLGKYMAQTIRSYPYMMLSDEICAPFIHRECMINSKLSTHKNEPGPLLRCTAIVELWRSKTRNNASYLWRILRMEQERLMQEISEYEDLMAINALQAITIYFLLRVSSTDDENTDFDVPLIQTMTELSWRVRGVITAYCDTASLARPSVCGWVMVESLRRTIAALFIIELLFDISPGIINRRGNGPAMWSEMLLPCSQQLWEARTEAEWTHRYDLLGDERPYYGELLQHEYLDCDRSSLLERWMANVDDFGRLVINIASMAEVAQGYSWRHRVNVVQDEGIDGDGVDEA